MKRLSRMLAVLALGAAATGCAVQTAPIEAPSTELGTVIVYRNGVAYFERFAAPDEKAITLRVPTDRVDDFLKSLSVVDLRTGKPLALSYPTLASYDGVVEMTLDLPKDHDRLKITYVTASPAWKPSYRLVLGDDDGEARLQGWAVVDNASGENWEGVRIGVGATSALSFRYDLHSVRLVERQTLSSGEPLAQAPPTGGSPYAVATKKVRVLGNIALDQPASERVAMAPADDASGGDTAEAKPMQQPRRRGQRLDDKAYVEHLKREAKGNRIVVEGFAQPGEEDAAEASRNRAQKVRDKLVALGVEAARIDVVATGEYRAGEAVRILADEERAARSEGGGPAPRDTEPVGTAHFVSKTPLSIDADHSAMVSTLNAKAQAERVFFYDPVSARGSDRFAFNAVRLDNPTDDTLAGGPFTVYQHRQFLGEGLSEAIPPRSTAFIPYALDRSVVVEDEVGTREEIQRLVTIQRGVVLTESRRIRRTTLSVSNRGQEEAEVYVRHQVAPGFALTEGSKKARTEQEKLGGAHLFAVKVPAGEAVELQIEEETPLTKTVDIRTDEGVRDIALFLDGGEVPAELEGDLRAIQRRHTAVANLQESIAMKKEQLGVFRTRVDELNLQLISLRKVRQAAKLRRHLTEKMEEISDRLQALTLEVTDEEGELMTLRIALQDQLAELSLEPSDEEAKPRELARSE